MTWKLGDTLVTKKDFRMLSEVDETSEIRPKGTRVVIVYKEIYPASPQHSYAGVVLEEVFKLHQLSWERKKKKTRRWCLQEFRKSYIMIPARHLTLAEVAEKGLKGLR